jgi:hypothetical protein
MLLCDWLDLEALEESSRRRGAPALSGSYALARTAAEALPCSTSRDGNPCASPRSTIGALLLAHGRQLVFE